MADINVVILVGRLTRDAELKYTPSGFAICKFSIAVNRRRKQGDQWVDEAHFFDISLLGKRGESLAQYLTKGTQVAIQGELRQNRWEQDGQSRSKVEVTANDIELLGGGRGGQGGRSEGGGASSPRFSQPNSFGGGNSGDGGNERSDMDFEDDIPF